MTNEEKIYRWITVHYKRARKEADFVWLGFYTNTNGVNNNSTIKVIVDTKRNYVTVINTKNPKRFGHSKCRPDDVFSYKFGVALAYARYSKETIPDYILDM